MKVARKLVMIKQRTEERGLNIELGEHGSTLSKVNRPFNSQNSSTSITVLHVRVGTDVANYHISLLYSYSVKTIPNSIITSIIL